MASLNKLTYPQRLFIWLLGYSMLLVGCFTLFQYHREKEFKAAEIDSQLQLINTYILSELQDGIRPENISLADFKSFDNIRVSVISGDGKLIYDNTLDSLSQNNHLRREEIISAMKSGKGYAVRRHSESTGDSYFYSAQKGDDGQIVRSAVPYTVSLNTLLKADYGFLWVMGIISLIMCILGYLATRRVGTHIMRLNKFAESVEHGATISENEPFPNDELGNISNHIVRLYARLQQANRERDSEHRAALHEQKEKERIKKQLTNNINHELKTPVATIQICVETLLSHKNLTEENRNIFLKQCLTNTERLRKLLTDISLITRMDDGGTAIIKEPVNLTSIIAEAVAEREVAASAKEITIHDNVKRDLKMHGNVQLLESIFTNLIDNAIAYSGCSEIRIDATDITDHSITLEVSDNGTGISHEHLPRLFERFYRIDKGRSRAAGGTGLGLAIVKNAVAIHGGHITVANRTNGGLLFRMTLMRHS